MKRSRAACFAVFVSAVLLGCISTPQALSQTNTGSEPECLILYDAENEYSWIGQLHAEMLANLLGHFPLGAQIRGIETYNAGDLNSFAVTFYIGTYYDNPIPIAFLQDVMATAKPVCWFQYNLWQLSGSATFRTQFRNRFGFRFDALDSSGYSNVTYKAEVFSKDMLEPELGRVLILNTNLAQVPAIAWGGAPTNSIPYITHASNFWYVADTPFSFISEEDRYLVFADLLHDIVQIQHPESHRALIRLEDVDPTYPTIILRETADYLASEGVPFAVGVVPVYSDPLGQYNNDIPELVSMADEPAFVQTLRYMQSKGGQLIMHGYTHQYDSTPNPYTGVTGDDYEFFRVTVDDQGDIVTYQPVPEDSERWAQGRVQAGLQAFQEAGLSPVAWETPHYAASAVDSSVFGATFQLTMQRALYFEPLGHNAGQFFPYVIEKDIYGQKILPENLGNIDPSSWHGYPPRLPADLVRAARKNLVLRDGWASAYFHPYLGTNYLKQLVSGIKALGYSYLRLAEPPAFVSPPQSVTTGTGTAVTFSFEAEGTRPFACQWKFNGTNISGATNYWLILTNLQTAQAGAYTVSLSNAVGNVLSGPAALHVVAPFAVTNTINSSGQVLITFPTQSGLAYEVEWTGAPVMGPWVLLGSTNGTGAALSMEDLLLTGESRFYRVRAK